MVLTDGSQRCSFGFGNTVSGFLSQPNLPFAEVLTAEQIERVFAQHDGLFRRTYTTAIVLWAFMRQVLRDDKEVACQSASNAIRTTAVRSGRLHDVSPRQISFVSTCQFVQSGWDMMASGLMATESVVKYCFCQLKTNFEVRCRQSPRTF